LNTWKTYNLTVDNKSYPIKYQLTAGILNKIVPDTTLDIYLSTNSRVTFTIEVPKSLMGSKLVVIGGSEGVIKNDPKEFTLTIDTAGPCQFVMEPCLTIEVHFVNPTAHKEARAR
jgi:hypothetical protein